MKGNKGQIGNSWLGLSVVKKTDKTECSIVAIMSETEYKKTYDYEHYFTLIDNQGNTFQCGRSDFYIPR